MRFFALRVSGSSRMVTLRIEVAKEQPLVRKVIPRNKVTLLQKPLTIEGWYVVDIDDRWCEQNNVFKPPDD